MIRETSTKPINTLEIRQIDNWCSNVCVIPEECLKLLYINFLLERELLLDYMWVIGIWCKQIPFGEIRTIKYDYGQIRKELLHPCPNFTTFQLYTHVFGLSMNLCSYLRLSLHTFTHILKRCFCKWSFSSICWISTWDYNDDVISFTIITHK